MPWLILIGLGAYFGWKHIKGAPPATLAAPPAPPMPVQDTMTAPPPIPEQGVTAAPTDDGGAPAPTDGGGASGGGGYADPGPGVATSAPSAPVPADVPVQVMAAKLQPPTGYQAVDPVTVAPIVPAPRVAAKAPTGLQAVDPVTLAPAPAASPSLTVPLASFLKKKL